MTNNPLRNIEDKKAQIDLGVIAARTFRGALSETHNWFEAYLCTCAFFTGMFRGPNDANYDETGNND